jgi:predicted metalloprotease
MRMDDSRESENVEDRRGSGGGMGGGGGIGLSGGRLGLGAIVIALVAMYFGVDPAVVLQILDPGSQPQSQQQQQQQQQAPASPPPANDQEARFVSKVLAETEDTWTALFQGMNRTYVDPKLVLYSGVTRTACGTGQAAMGPFYCPNDSKVYLDLSFFNEMKRRFNAPGDFAQAYVIAHEVGHHVQHLLGTMDRVDQLRSQSPGQANALSVRLELQADCYAGLWARRADEARHILDSGDLQEALNAASAIGDDRLQKQSQGYVVPDSFTHGTSAQRVRWFTRGFQSGDLKQCDTFGASTL